MDSKLIAKAMYNKIPVFYNGKKYKRIIEYILWYDYKGEKQLSCTLLEMNTNTSIRVKADKIYLEE